MHNPIEDATPDAIRRMYHGWKKLVDEAPRRLPPQLAQEASDRIMRAGAVHAHYVRTQSRESLAEVAYLLTPVEGAHELLANYLRFAMQLLAESLMAVPPPPRPGAGHVPQQEIPNNLRKAKTQVRKLAKEGEDNPDAPVDE